MQMKLIIMMLLCISSYQRNSIANPTIPEDVLTPSEIEEITANRNVFFRKDLPNKTSKWNRWENRKNNQSF